MVALDDGHWWYRGRRRIVRSQIKRVPLPPGARLLDAGCGSGRTLDDLETFGIACGIDSSSWAVAAARSRGHSSVVLGTVEHMPFPDQHFDLVTCLDVLEHTADDELTMAELARVTRPGGHLLVTVPAYQSLWSAHDEANRHYRRYRRRTLRDVAVAAGWEPIHDSYFNSLLLPPAALVRLLRRNRYRDTLRSELSFTPRWLDPILAMPFRFEAAVLRHGRLPAGLSLIALLRRPAVATAEAPSFGPERIRAEAVLAA